MINISNPVNFETWDELVVPAGTSSAMMLQTKNVGEGHIPVVHMASDHDDAKKVLTDIIASTGLDSVDVGDLKRAREMEALGFLQMRLTKDQKVSPTGGYLLIK